MSFRACVARLRLEARIDAELHDVSRFIRCVSSMAMWLRSMTAKRAGVRLSPLVWVSAFETGDPEIDKEHQELLLDLNDLSELLVQGQEWLLVVGKSQRLRDRCFDHFQGEEVVLEGAAYEGLECHKIEHRVIEQQLDGILSFIANVAIPSRAAIEAVLLLRSILVNHFFRYDIPYKTHLLRSRGQERGAAGGS